MEDHTPPSEPPDHERHDERGDTAVAVKTRPRPQRPRTDRLPPWKVLLHNDDVNTIEYVVLAVMELTRLNEQAAIMVVLEAHHKGLALVMATHREHAELLHEQFQSKRLTVTIEPDR